MDVTKYRDEFPITRNYLFLDHAAVAPLSARAAAAMRAYVDSSRDHAYLEGAFYKHAEHVRQLAARLIGADSDEVTFIKCTTEGIAFVANGLQWRTGHNVVTTNVEFPANIYPWMNLQSRGVRLRMVPEEAGRVDLDRVVEAIDDRTRVVSISAVQFGSGFRTDLAALGEVCKERGVLFCVDAIQALGALPIDVHGMRIDFLAADAHKWMCGPEGCGLFYCRRELLGHLRPSMVGWTCMKNAFRFDEYQFEFLDDARRFDCGSYNLAGVCGMGGAIELLLEAGIEPISRRVLALTDRLVEGLRGKGYRVVSSRRPGEASGIVAFTSDRHDLAAIERHLRSEYRIVVSTRVGRLRASPHFYNTPEEMDRLIDALPAH